MALTEENGGGGGGMVMPVAPMYGGGGGGFGNGFGGDGWWILLLFILLGGWNNNGNGGGFGGGMGGLYPWMNQSNQISEGFQNQLMNDNITSIRDGIFGISTQLCNNQMSDLERSFAVQSALQNCCCENRAATQDLKYTVATEASATRAANANNTQAILDKLCALELEGVKTQLAQAQRDNVGLQNQLNMANLAASQVAQTAQITNDVYQRLATCPVGTVPVYGETPIFRCNNNNGCGCGCGNNF